jgi:cell wall-associated NlpC family hydrolase
MPSSLSIITKAREYLGTPFHHQARVKGKGVDCAGLLVLVARELGADVIDDTTYDHDPHPETLKRYLASQPFLVEVLISHRQIGDMVLMDLKDTKNGRGHHLALLTDIGILHAYAPAHKVVETTLDYNLERGIVGVYRWVN